MLRVSSSNKIITQDSPETPGGGKRKTVVARKGAVLMERAKEKRKTGDRKGIKDTEDMSMEMEYRSKEKKLKPDKVYRFRCDGHILRDRKSQGKKAMEKDVQYRAEFNGSVEEFVYPSLRISEEKARPRLPSGNSCVDFSKDYESEKSQTDFALHWKLKLEDVPSADDDSRPYNAITEKGENTLREVIRLKYHDRYLKEKPMGLLRESTFRNARKRNLLASLQKIRNDDQNGENPDDLYYKMVVKSKADDMGKKFQKMVDLSPVERAYEEKAENLARILPGNEIDPEIRQHMPGLMYYQIRNNLSEKKANDNMAAQLPTRPCTVSNPMPIYSEDEEDEETDAPPARKHAPPISGISKRQDRYRSHRGISFDCVDEVDETKTKEDLRAMTELKTINNDEYSCSALTRIRRAHNSAVAGFALHGNDNDEEESSNYIRDLSTDGRKRHAQDLLLAQELRQGVIPERLLRKIPRMGDLISLDLSHYGIGDDLCICLGKSLAVLEMLHTLGLRGNRLTHKSLSVIFENLSLRALRHLDVSMNTISGPSFESLCKRLRHNNCKLSSLELVKTGITFFEVRTLVRSIMHHETSWLMELSLSQNKLGCESMREIVRLLKYDGCALTLLDLSWNELNAESGECLAGALASNKTLTCVDLSSNALRDEGGQHMAACLLNNNRLQELHLSLNNIGGKTCFIFSKVLRRHPSMKRLNLSDNPLTEAGARSIFRTILKGLRCFVMMQNCTFNSEDGLFKHSNPSLDSPYVLDLGKPYEVSILSELINMVNNPTNQCTFRNISYRASEKDKSQDIIAEYADGETYLRCGSTPWAIPPFGILTVNFVHQLSIPKENMAIDELAFNTILAIVVNARSEKDRRNWLFLMCMDAYFTTDQAQDLIDILDDRRLLGPGGISVVEFFRCIWSNIIDTENIYDFLYHNLDDEERISLMHLLTFEKFRFNWINPTGHWRLDLSSRVQRSVMMQLIALNIVESKASKKSKRGDTSQKGNWCNFRNEKHNGALCDVDIEFSKTLPWHGVLEFDYVSTTRPHPDVETITDEEFGDFISKLGLTTRRRLDVSKSAVKLLELQLAVTKYYFHASRVINILDCFSKDDLTQARVVVILFSRIYDLYNFEVVFRHVTAAATQDIFERLGFLNCINPLKPTHNLKLNMRYVDCRIVAHTLLSMSSLENGDQLKQHPRSEVDIIVMYAQLGRIVQDEYQTDTMLMFTYCEVGERQSELAWSFRKEACHKFLVGTRPWDTKMFKIIKMYKEIVAANALMVGPIDLQYAEFTKHRVRRRKNIIRGAGMVSKLKNDTLTSRNKEPTEEESEQDTMNTMTPTEGTSFVGSSMSIDESQTGRDSYSDSKSFPPTVDSLSAEDQSIASSASLRNAPGD